MKPQKLRKEQIQNTLTSAITEAVNFIESEVAPERIKAQKYFDGQVSFQAEEGRSRVVATKCRDTIRAIKPALMRLFLQSGKPVEFVPSRPDAAMEAEQKTRYAKYIFDKNNGFRLLSNAFDDALKKKTGILKACAEEYGEVEIDEYSGLNDDQVALLMQDPEIEVLEQEADEYGMTEMKVSRKSKRKRIKIMSIAPEDFFVDRNAVTIDDCYICGHSTITRVGDVVEMGFGFEEVYDLAGADSSSVAEEEDLQRQGWDQEDTDEDAVDPSMRKILLTEAYMRMDIEGTGIPRLYKFICGSDKYTILDYELADVRPFAIFEVDPEAHTFFGRSLVEIIMDDQDASTAMLRGLLDNINMVNNPRLIVGKNGVVSMDDVLNNEIGAVIRAQDVNQVREIVIGSASTGILPAMTYYDETIRAKTGVSGAGMGLDADLLQSQTAQGVNAAVQAANQVAELIARHLAEGGMKQLFTIIVQLARQHADPEEMMRVGGVFQPVDPRSWTATADMSVNVGLGTGRHDERAMALRETLQTQLGLWANGGGPMNGLVTLTTIRNTLADILELAGLHNADRYYNPMDPQMEQQLLAQVQQAQPQQGSDPNAAFLQAEGMKTSARVQADRDKAMLDWAKAQMQDDRERDRMTQDLAIKVAEIFANTGVKLDANAVRAAQAQTQPGMPNVANQV